MTVHLRDGGGIYLKRLRSMRLSLLGNAVVDGYGKKAGAGLVDSVEERKRRSEEMVNSKIEEYECEGVLVTLRALMQED